MNIYNPSSSISKRENMATSISSLEGKSGNYLIKIQVSTLCFISILILIIKCDGLTGNQFGENGTNETSSNGLVEEFGNLCELQKRQFPYTELDISTVRRPRAGTSGGKKRDQGNIAEFLWTYYPVPVEKAHTKIPWLQDEFLRFCNPTHDQFKNNIDLFERQIQLFTIKQLYEELSSKNPIFGAQGYNTNYYEDREESTSKLEYFLSHQMGHETEEFINFLFNWLNKTSGKFNCLSIVGPPSSGKTYFARILKHAMITSGQIANMNRNSTFPFNNCVNKRLLHWDEPNFEPSAIENLKLLFSGDELSANIKYQNFTTIVRTPVICTANMEVFPLDSAFNCRIKRYTFQNFPELKDWMYLHPMSLFDLFNNRNLI